MGDAVAYHYSLDIAYQRPILRSEQEGEAMHVSEYLKIEAPKATIGYVSAGYTHSGVVRFDVAGQWGSVPFRLGQPIEAIDHKWEGPNLAAFLFGKTFKTDQALAECIAEHGYIAALSHNDGQSRILARPAS